MAAVAAAGSIWSRGAVSYHIPLPSVRWDRRPIAELFLKPLRRCWCVGCQTVAVTFLDKACALAGSRREHLYTAQAASGVDYSDERAASSNTRAAAPEGRRSPLQGRSQPRHPRETVAALWRKLGRVSLRPARGTVHV